MRRPTLLELQDRADFWGEVVRSHWSSRLCIERWKAIGVRAAAIATACSVTAAANADPAGPSNAQTAPNAKVAPAPSSPATAGSARTPPPPAASAALGAAAPPAPPPPPPLPNPPPECKGAPALDAVASTDGEFRIALDGETTRRPNVGEKDSGRRTVTILGPDGNAITKPSIVRVESVSAFTKSTDPTSTRMCGVLNPKNALKLPNADSQSDVWRVTASFDRVAAASLFPNVVSNSAAVATDEAVAREREIATVRANFSTNWRASCTRKSSQKISWRSKRNTNGTALSTARRPRPATLA
jgi:hypothetical protein